MRRKSPAIDEQKKTGLSHPTHANGSELKTRMRNISTSSLVAKSVCEKRGTAVIRNPPMKHVTKPFNTSVR
jgi:hypothetical protein